MHRRLARLAPRAPVPTTWLLSEGIVCDPDRLDECDGEHVAVRSPNPGVVVGVFTCLGGSAVVGTCFGHSPEVRLVDRALAIRFIGGTGSTCGCFGHDFVLVIEGVPSGTWEVAAGEDSAVVTVE